MNWNEDEELWTKLDTLLRNCEKDLDEFLTCLYKYHDDLDLTGQAILFGGIGKLVMNYNHNKFEKPEEGLAIAFQSMHADRRVQKLMGHAVEQTIDKQINKMKGE